jgi:hypothetical protein
MGWQGLGVSKEELPSAMLHIFLRPPARFLSNLKRGGKPTMISKLITKANPLLIAAFSAFFFSISIFSISEAVVLTYEHNTDRPGKDYKHFDLPTPDYNLCSQACKNDPECKAYTYVKPGIQGSKAKCWLKSEIPSAKSGDCCISGIKRPVGPSDTTPSSPQGSTPQKQFSKSLPKPGAMPDPLPKPGAMPDPLPKPGAMPDPLPAPTLLNDSSSREHAAIQSVSDFEPDTDRPGKDYRSFDLSAPDPNLCRQECIGDPKCKAFTYVKPGIQGPAARCWLKSEVPAAKAHSCCVSGVVTREKATGTAPSAVRQRAPSARGRMAQDNVDLPGMDYKNFDLPVADPRFCEQSCLDDPQCMAYTYVKPGIQGAKARCWLKHGVPQAKISSCCVSGIKERIAYPVDPRTQPEHDTGSKVEGFTMSPQAAAGMRKLKQFDSTWQIKLQSKVNEVTARMQMKMNQRRQFNGMLMQKNILALDSAMAKNEEAQICLTPDGRLEICPEGHGLGRADPSPKIESYFALTNGFNKNIVAGDSVMICGYNFGDEVGHLKFEMIQSKGSFVQPVNVSYDTLSWTDTLILIKIADKIPGLLRPIPMVMEIRNRKNTWAAGFRALSVMPKMVVTNISGMGYLKRDDDGERGSSVEKAVGVVKVSHDPGCSFFDWSGNSGDDWFFKQHPLPDYVTLLDYNIQAIRPDLPDSALEAIIWGVEKHWECALDIFMLDAPGIGLVVLGTFCGWLDEDTGSYSLKVIKPPKLPDDATIRIHWENTCTNVLYQGLPIEYLATFLVTYPEGYPAP